MKILKKLSSVLMATLVSAGVAQAQFSVGSGADVNDPANFDINRYLGKWFEVISNEPIYQVNCRCTTANYTFSDNVLGIENRCRRVSDSNLADTDLASVDEQITLARARNRGTNFEYYADFLEPVLPSFLLGDLLRRVSANLPPNYVILGLGMPTSDDPSDEGYRYPWVAIRGIGATDTGPFNALYVLSRTPALDEAVLTDIIEEASQSSLAPQNLVADLELTTQVGCPGVVDASGDLEDVEKDIVQTAIDAGNFSILTQAIIASGLEQTLRTASVDFTVFAPTDEAFRALGLDVNSDLSQLADVLLYHVVPNAAITAESLLALESIDTALPGTSISIDSAPARLSAVVDRLDKLGLRDRFSGVLGGSDQDPAHNLTVNGVNIVIKDIEASNGIIHVIDAVLDPASQE